MFNYTSSPLSKQLLEALAEHRSIIGLSKRAKNLSNDAIGDSCRKRDLHRTPSQQTYANSKVDAIF